MTRKKCLIRVGLCMGLLAAVVGAWSAANATALRAYWAARQLRAASSDEERARAAERLGTLGDHGLARLVEFIRAGDEPNRSAAAGAIERRLESVPEADPWALTAAVRLAAAMASADAAGQRAILALLPNVPRRAGPGCAGKCRETVAAGLASIDAAVRVQAVRLALHPGISMRREVVPLLADPASEVRSAALVATAMPGDGEPLISDEDLFRWLHDPDEVVRTVCHGALVSRDRTEAEIILGSRLTNPDPRERLLLLLDLRYGNELADPEPWLERLSRDIEPAVRAGAARVAVEISGDRRLSCPAWVDRVATTDPDPTVRRVASHFRGIPPQDVAGIVRQTGAP